jgi:hypothetical protein
MLFELVEILSALQHVTHSFVVEVGRAYSERCRSAFRTDGDHDSKLMPITIPK